ncbi:hypothetical protein STEG23_002050 [Scotinomys teguina]
MNLQTESPLAAGSNLEHCMLDFLSISDPYFLLRSCPQARAHLLDLAVDAVLVILDAGSKGSFTAHIYLTSSSLQRKPKSKGFVEIQQTFGGSLRPQRHPTFLTEQAQDPQPL